MKLNYSRTETFTLNFNKKLKNILDDYAKGYDDLILKTDKDYIDFLNDIVENDGFESLKDIIDDGELEYEKDFTYDVNYDNKVLDN